MILGMDEAGRGPVFGPMVLAGVASDESSLEKLSLRDSKKCTKGMREKLFREIKDVAERIEVIKVSSIEIDRMRGSGRTMNDVEVGCFTKLIKKIDCDTIYIDSLAGDFKNRMQSSFPRKKLICEYKADENYPIVSAASIIAKVVRDRDMKKIEKRLRDRISLPLGSGYTSDKTTIRFLEEWFKNFSYFPEHMRRSWKTSERYMNERLSEDLKRAIEIIENEFNIENFDRTVLLKIGDKSFYFVTRNSKVFRIKENEPQITIEMSWETFGNVTKGEMSLLKAYALRKIRVKASPDDRLFIVKLLR